MRSLKVKVCGMRDAANIEVISRLLPDFLGFIFYPKSPRYVLPTLDIPQIPSEIKRVGVFVDQTSAEIMSMVDQFHLQYVQLHGNESVAQCACLKLQGVGVIKTFSVDQDFSFENAKPYYGIVDYFLFDTKGKSPGGNGVAFDWNLLHSYDQQVPFFLSGGITSNNVFEIKELRHMNIIGLDVNSGIEKSAGVKDFEKFSQLLNNLKAIELIA